ncbi:MAG TPA: MarC family protein [Steroidobacteraceae bacterium]|nr:MarC family protein [Steroidobacteraceae bacterium]
MFEQSLKFFVVFFVVVDPVSLIPLFTGLTAGASVGYKRRMAVKSVSISAGILGLFAFGGAAFLQLMGISLEAFRIFGGLLLFLLALEMVFARESGARTSSDEAAENRRRADIAVFPLAFPFIAGPAALATILLWFGRIQLPAQAGLFAGLMVAAALVLAVVLALLWVAEPVMRVIGVTGANVASRLLGVVLGALAVQFVLDGLRAAFGAG